MTQPLDDAEIKRRLARLANLERLHKDLKARYAQLEEKYEALKKENELLKAAIAAQNTLIESLKLRLEELERMVFGRRKKQDNSQNNGQNNTPSRSSSFRPASSYRRPTPLTMRSPALRNIPSPNAQSAARNSKTSKPWCGTRKMSSRSRSGGRN